MKRIIMFIVGTVGFFSTLSAQNNYIPGLNPNSGSVAFGLPSAPSTNAHNFQLHGTQDYCVPDNRFEFPPKGGPLPPLCYGVTSRFSMTNSLTGISITDGMIFRMSKLNFVIENQEKQKIDIKSGVVSLHFDGATKLISMKAGGNTTLKLDGTTEKAWFGGFTNVSQGNISTAAVNMQSLNDNGLFIRTYSAGKYGLTVRTRLKEDIAIQVYGDGSGNKNFAVNGNGFVFARKYTTTLANIPDYVFEPDYDLMSLKDLRNYIEVNHHLPNIPSAKEYEKTGVDLGEMNRLLLEKVEELTLYTLQLEERLKKLEEVK